MINETLLKSIISNILIKANTVLGKEVYNCLGSINDENLKSLILKNHEIANTAKRPLCQDTGQVMVFLKLPFDFSFGYDFKKIINQAVEETYEKEFYRKSIVNDALFDRTNTKNNTPAIIYTDFENRKNVKIDVLIKGGGAENMSFVKMFNPTTSQKDIIEKLEAEISSRAKNACPPLFIGIGVGGTMDYCAQLSKKALFEGVTNDFCKSLIEKCGDYVILAKMITSSTHIASLPVAVTINCHSNRHSGCEITDNEVSFINEPYDSTAQNLNFEGCKNVGSTEELKAVKSGEKILFSGMIYTMRDAAHKKIFELIEKGEALPFEIKNSIIFYAGPAPKKADEIIGPIGPTTAKRMDKFAPKLYDMGCVATIGKGNRSEEVKKACLKNNAHYLTAQGGVACLLQKCFKKAQLIAFEELGPEAIYKFEVENLPLTVEF